MRNLTKNCREDLKTLRKILHFNGLATIIKCPSDLPLTKEQAKKIACTTFSKHLLLYVLQNNLTKE